MKCKLGDLAFIRKSLRPANVGLVVECKDLLGYLFKDETFMWNGEMWAAQETDFIWVIESKSGSLDTQFGKASQAYIPDSWLTPIKPDSLDKTDEESLENEDNLETL